MSKPKSKVPWRTVHGVLLLDKPAGMSSNQALQRAKYLFLAEKAGHTGSLDPLATGMLPLCFGEATKIAGLLLGARKVYETEARLGVETDTLDAEGEVVRQRPIPVLSNAQVESVLRGFVGEIEQIPPAYSAIKRDGVPLYRLARAGEPVEVEPRRVQVHSIELLGLRDGMLKLRVHCGSGTYIRSLVRDIGDALGCGAHVAALRRLWVAPFEGADMISLEQLEALSHSQRMERLMGMEPALSDQPSVQLDAADAEKLSAGQRLPCPHAPGEYIAWCEGKVRAKVRIDDAGVMHPQRVLHSFPTEAGLHGKT